ncbi:MAG: M36 family metallopeptidase [Tepidisphaeraceae bacterium]
MTSFGVRKILPILIAVALALPAVASNSAPAQDVDPAGAIDYVKGSAAKLGVTRADVADVFVTSKFKSSHSGVTHVNLNQRYQGLEVFGAHATVSVAAGGEVIFASGALLRDLGARASGDENLDATEAVEAAADALELDEPENLRVLSQEGGPAEESVLSSGGISDAPIPARLGWQPTKQGLRLAWQLTIDDTTDVHLWNAGVDAETGDLLDVDDWTIEDQHKDLESTLKRGGGATALAADDGGPVSPNPVIDGSSYRVLDIPTESPNDAERGLLTNPADGLASPFGWHDTNGVPGAEFTNTRGNNVHAYLDQDNNNQADFGDTDGGPGLTFDFPADLGEHAQHYRDAVATNLFYGCNAFHDVFYRYGFDEPSGNFQANNYGRGGGQGDYVRCEAADGGGTNNANFSTPAADAGTPRMQMYLWPGNQFGSQNQVAVGGLGEFGASWSRFGPPATNAGITAPIVLVNDGSANPTEGCGPLVGFPAGAIALVDRGTCTFLEKVQSAEAAGASAVIIANNVAGSAPVLAGSMVAAPPGIPAVSVTQDDGNAIETSLPATGTVRKHPDHPGIRDGDFENGIIFHEYGHGLSLRLTGGPGINCLSGNEQAGEGWSDYVAISTLLDPARDDPQGPRGMGPYALFQDSRQGNGIRPRPYSRNMEIQPFTYDSIKSNAWLNGTSLALPHGLGHGWAAVLWDVTWDLVDKHGFNPNVYEPWFTGGNNRAIQYVVDGLKLQGCGPGLVVARAAIIAGADELSDGEDTCTLWASFSRRGLGFSAVQGTTNRNDNDEAFDTHPDCLRGFRPPVSQPYGTLRNVDAGDTVPLRFTADGYTELDVLASNSPFSRRVDCETLRVPSQGEFTTPRELPVPTETPGNSKLTVDGNGVFHYNWKTLEEWGGTCREVVVTRDDGRQHRAFFRFL